MNCSICGLPICPPGCPNREREEKRVACCSVCGGGIRFGEVFYRLGSDRMQKSGIPVCSSCMEGESLAGALLTSKPLYLALCPREEVIGEWEPKN